MSFKYEKILLFPSSSTKISYSEVWCWLFQAVFKLQLVFQSSAIVTI